MHDHATAIISLPSIAQGQFGQGLTSSSLNPATDYSTNYAHHLNGSYGQGQMSNASAVSSRNSSRPSTANSLPPNNGGQYSPGSIMLQNGNSRAPPPLPSYNSNNNGRCWASPPSRSDGTAFVQYNMHAPYGQERSNRN